MLFVVYIYIKYIIKLLICIFIIVLIYECISCWPIWFCYGVAPRANIETPTNTEQLHYIYNYMRLYMINKEACPDS